MEGVGSPEGPWGAPSGGALREVERGEGPMFPLPSADTHGLGYFGVRLYGLGFQV